MAQANGSKNFDELLSEERTFVVRGETFRWRDVRPEVLTAMGSAIGDDTDPNNIWKAQDEQILLFIHDEDHDKWKALREREEDPVTVRQFNAILEWLVSEQTDRPTPTPSPSASGRGRTAASSRGA